MLKEAIQTVSDLWSLMVGLKVTKRYFSEPQITVRYPWKEVDNIATYKGHLELVAAKDPFKAKCISCGMCALACPSNCLTVVKRKAPKLSPEEEKAQAEAKANGEKVKDKTPKDPEKFLYDYTLCSLCGTCMENCPVGSLAFTGNVYKAGYSRNDFHFDLVQMLAEKASAKVKPVAEPVAEPAATETSEA
jgi:NADH-quinone oxidoreductase subunit I